MEEAKVLWIKYKTKPDKDTRDKLIKTYLGLVKYIVKKLQMYLPPDLPSSERDDLISCGVIGLMDAIEKFDIKRGIKFKTYALPRIKGTILDELRAMDWAPRSIRKKAKQIDEAYSNLENQFLRPATDEEVSKYLEISIYELHYFKNKVNQTNILSLDKVCKIRENGQTIQMIEIIEDKQRFTPEEELERIEKIEILKDAIEKLPERERLVIALYYFEELNLKEIGRVLDVTESRISQMHTKAVVRLKARLSKSREEVYA